MLKCPQSAEASSKCGSFLQALTSRALKVLTCPHLSEVPSKRAQIADIVRSEPVIAFRKVFTEPLSSCTKGSLTGNLARAPNSACQGNPEVTNKTIPKPKANPSAAFGMARRNAGLLGPRPNTTDAEAEKRPKATHSSESALEHPERC